jgi:hypothetical protein
MSNSKRKARFKSPLRMKLKDYLKKKTCKLSSEEATLVRSRFEQGETNVYKLAKEFGCVPTQIAGVKSWVTRK